MPNETLSESEHAAIRAHVERFIGAVQQEIIDDRPGANVTVLHVPAVQTRPLHTLITSGVSARAAHAPSDTDDSPTHLELMITLPERWKLDAQSRRDEQWNWPVGLLHTLAWRTLQEDLGWGHVVPNGDPPKQYAASTKLCGALIVPSLLVPTGFYELVAEQKRIVFYAVVPLYEEELGLNETYGTQALMERIVDRDLNDIVEAKRRNVAKKKFGFF